MFRMFQEHKQHVNDVRLLKIPKSLGKEEQADSLIVSTGRLHCLSSVSHKLFDWAAFTDQLRTWIGTKKCDAEIKKSIYRERSRRYSDQEKMTSTGKFCLKDGQIL
jgi:hypothetical protein